MAISVSLHDRVKNLLAQLRWKSMTSVKGIAGVTSASHNRLRCDPGVFICLYKAFGHKAFSPF